MLCAVHHKWPSGAWFAFNCYRHWATLVIRAGDETGHFVHRKEGVNQGNPLAMIAYGLGILPLIWELRAYHPRVTQPWYADDDGAGGKFAGIRWNLDDLMVQGPLQSYFPEPTNSIVVVSPRNILREETFFRGYGLQVVAGIRYLGVFVGTEAMQARWLEEKLEGWRYLVAIMSGISGRHPQTAYVGRKKSLQQEWDFMQRVTPGIGPSFQPVEDKVHNAFLPALFKGSTYNIPVRAVTSLSVN